MSFTPPVATLANAGTEKLRELPMPAWAFGAISLASFLLLLGVLWTFRNTAAKYDTPVRAQQGRGSGHGEVPGSHGAADPGAHH